MTNEDIRRIVKEELRNLTHTGLRGMPDFGALNRDHDNRYIQMGGIGIVDELRIAAKDYEPENPREGYISIWLSTGNVVGTEPSLMIKITWDGVTYSGYIPTTIDMT